MIEKLAFVVWQAIQFPFLLGLVCCTRVLVDKSDNPWVISGHRGRIKSDNASALFDYISQQTDQPIIWIYQEEHAKDADVDPAQSVPRNSVRARIVLARAPVLIYSHGEDDLDCLAILLRRLLGKRIYVGHGANLVKRATMHPDILARLGLLKRRFLSWLATDYDYLLCSSEEEQQNWDANKPGKRGRHIVSGGAPRLDLVLPLTHSQPVRKIVWVPTFRDTRNANRLLLQTLQTAAQYRKLQSWLDEKGFELAIGCHINTEVDALSLLQDNRHVKIIPPAQLWHHLSTAACLITDYSSILVDWLLFDRPAIFFAFDLDDYRKGRGFHREYEDYLYGELVTNLEDLVDLIVSEKWHDMKHTFNSRARLKNRFFPSLEGNNARLHYDKIRTLTGSPPRYRKTGQDLKIGETSHNATNSS